MKGGTPAQINMMRERGAEGAGAVAYLRDRFAGKPGDNMPKRIQQAIQSFEKGKWTIKGQTHLSASEVGR